MADDDDLVMVQDPSEQGWSITPALRWVQSERDDAPPVLQQAWQGIGTGELRWENVETVYVVLPVSKE